MSRVAAAGAFVLGIVVLAWLAVRGFRETPTVREAGAPPGESAALKAALDDLAWRVDSLAVGGSADPALAERVARLEERVESLDDELARVSAEAAARAPEPKEDLEALATEDLAIRARAAAGRRDFAAAAEYWEAYLARGPETEEKGSAELNLGMAYRMLGDTDRELAAFEAALATLGENSEAGLTALFHVGWTNATKGNDLLGRDLMLRVAADEKSNPYIRKWARYWSADYSVRVNDTGRAREILDGIVEDYREATEQTDRLLLQYATRKLAELDGR